MGGRYLLIEFDDDTAATNLREQINAATRKGKRFRVVGLFARPGRACECIISPDVRSKDRVVRGGKFGWWLCTNCKKPRMGNHELNNLIIPPEVIEPTTFEGVDTMNPDVAPKPYIRHAVGISIVTLPERVAHPTER